MHSKRPLEDKKQTIQNAPKDTKKIFIAVRDKRIALFLSIVNKTRAQSQRKIKHPRLTHNVLYI